MLNELVRNYNQDIMISFDYLRNLQEQDLLHPEQDLYELNYFIFSETEISKEDLKSPASFLKFFNANFKECVYCEKHEPLSSIYKNGFCVNCIREIDLKIS